MGAIDWLHTLEFPNHTTKGRYDWRPYLHYFVPDNVKGKTLLDVGAGDGFFSFEFEKMGAAVTALDLASQDDRDNSKFGNLNKITQQRHKDSFAPGFNFAKRTLESNVKYITMNLYNLSDFENSYDIVFCNDVLLHLTDPFRALCAFCNVCKNTLVVSTPLYVSRKPIEVVGTSLLRKFPVSSFVGADRKNAFWLPNVKCMQDMVIGAGFKILETKVFRPKKEHAEYSGLRGIVVAVKE
jgi:tRNA (mo5U34)-methyltransferase